MQVQESGACEGTSARLAARRLVVVASTQRVATGQIGAIRLRRISIHERSRVQRMAHAANLVFEREFDGIVARIDDVKKAVLVLIAFFSYETPLFQTSVRA